MLLVDHGANLLAVALLSVFPERRGAVHVAIAVLARKVGLLVIVSGETI